MCAFSQPFQAAAEVTRRHKTDQERLRDVVCSHSLSRITTAVDTALRVTAVPRFSSFLLQLVNLPPPPPGSSTNPTDPSVASAAISPPQHLWSCPAELCAQTQKLCKRHNNKINILTFRQKVLSVEGIKFQIDVSHKIAENKNYIPFTSWHTK